MPELVIYDSPEWAWCQFVYASHERRKEVFRAVSSYFADHRRGELGVSITSGEIDGRPNVCVGVPSQFEQLLREAPYGADAIAVPVGREQAMACWLRHIAVGEPGMKALNHDEAAARALAYLQPDGQLGEKP